MYHMTSHDISLFYRNTLTMGEIGCFMSHYNIWKDVSNTHCMSGWGGLNKWGERDASIYSVHYLYPFEFLAL